MSEIPGIRITDKADAASLVKVIGVDTLGNVKPMPLAASSGLDLSAAVADIGALGLLTTDHEGRIDALEAGQGSGTVGYASFAAMDADTSQDSGTLGRVGESEADESLRGIYLYTGSPLDWVFDSPLPASQRQVDEIEQSGLWEELDRLPAFYAADAGGHFIPVGYYNLQDGTYSVYGGLLNEALRLDVPLEDDGFVRRYSDEYDDAIVGGDDDRILSGTRKPRLGPKWVGGIDAGDALVWSDMHAEPFQIAAEITPAIGIQIEQNVARVFGGSPFSDRVIRLYGPTSIDPTCSRIRQVGRTGQSVDMGYGDSVPIHTSAIEAGFVVMFASGIRKRGTDQSQPWSGFSAEWEEGERLVDAYEFNHGLSGETGLAYLGSLMWRDGAATDAILVATEAMGSTNASENSTGVMLQNVIDSFVRGYEIAMINGLDWVPDHCRYDAMQAEAVSGTSKAAAMTLLTTFQAALTTAVNAATGHVGEIRVVSTQPAGGASLGAAQAMLQVARDFPTKHLCPGPGYVYEHVASESPFRIHRTATGHCLAEAYANRTVRDGELPLHVTSAVRTLAEVVLSFGGREGALSLDTSVVSNPGNFGVSWVDNGDGNVVTISSVALFNANTQIKVTLSATPTGTGQKIRVVDVGDASDSGPTTGKRSNIRDSAPDTEEIDSVTYNLYRYCCRDEIVVT